MRFSDIHKYTSCGNWEVHVRLTYLKENIDHWVSTSNLQLNPDFQRGHVWTESNKLRMLSMFSVAVRTQSLFTLINPVGMGTIKVTLFSLMDCSA